MQLNRKYNPNTYFQRINFHPEKLKPILMYAAFWGVFFTLITIFNLRDIYNDRIYKTSDDINGYFYAIVFGAGNTETGSNEIIEDRVLTAINLYKEGKIQRIFLTGTLQEGGFDEVAEMKKQILAKEVPEFVIIEDKNSDRTYDSCFRAKTEFKINKAILITQEYHMNRALYLCNSLGINSIGFLADKRAYPGQSQIKLRESFAIVKAAIDLNLLRPKPE